MIDLHSHVLPGLDDGPRTLEESVGILRAMARDGSRIVVATPHVRRDYPTTPEQMRSALKEVRRAAEVEGIRIDVVGGGEIALERVDAMSVEELGEFGLGGNRDLVLIECPYTGWTPLLERHVSRLREAGIRPIVAHPERNPTIVRNPKQLASVVEAGAIVQLTAASVDGRLGRPIARCARALLGLGLAHTLASDAHLPAVRAAGLSAAVRSLGSPELGRWLVEDVPAALLTDSPLPRRPARPRRRLWPVG